MDKLLANNRKWSAAIRAGDPTYFERLSKIQAPEYLWIGCSDSRVPANQIIDLPPGEVFVHRNIANVVGHTDMNCLSVIQYAVEYLKVKHIIVCGHYGCGGVHAALGETEFGLIDNWLRQIKDIRNSNKKELSGLSEKKRADRLCEMNVSRQVSNVAHTTIVQDAWKKGADLEVHGLIYGLIEGRLDNLQNTVKNNAQLVTLDKDIGVL